MNLIELIESWSNAEPTIIELIQLWLNENAPDWQVFFGALITIEPKDDMRRWQADKKIYLGYNEVSIDERKVDVSCKPSNRWITTKKLSVADPEFFNKLKEELK